MSETLQPTTSAGKRCFVVMGFGTKTDLATGRKINLDNSYNALIKPVLVAKGLECTRADEIRHTGTIDVPMYQELLTADIVIADISTANTNAIYELGIRHALRPRTTIVISEHLLNYPFDLSHILITKYETLGENIDYFEVMRFQKVLGDMIDSLLESTEADSPVYTFLDGLIPPSLKKTTEKLTRKVNAAIKAGREQMQQDVANSQADSQTLSILVKEAEDAMKERNFLKAKGYFASAIELAKCNLIDANFNTNPYLVHRLAQATYKTKLPTEVEALREGIKVLLQLDLAHTNDTETVALAGKIEKRLYYHGEGEDHLGSAISYFERAYSLLHNRYHGINLAFLLNWRVGTDLYNTENDDLADMVWANRYRREVLELCDRDLMRVENRIKSRNQNPLPARIESESPLSPENEELFWIYVNKAEAHLGLGETDQAHAADCKARELDPPSWMLQGYEGQIADLKISLEKHGHILDQFNGNGTTGKTSERTLSVQ